MGLFTGSTKKVRRVFVDTPKEEEEEDTEEEPEEETEDTQEETEEDNESEDENEGEEMGDETYAVNIWTGEESAIEITGLSKGKAAGLLDGIKNCTTRFFEYDDEETKYLIGVDRITSVQMSEE